jgi:periplasmic protein TonB
MFADSLLDSAWAHDSRRGWTTVLAFAVESVAVAGLLMLPLIYGEGLPQQLKSIARIVTPAPPPGPPAPLHAQNAQASNMSSSETLIEPQIIPSHTLMVADNAVPPMPDGGVYVMNGTGDRWTNNPVMHSILATVPTVVPPPAHPAVAHTPPVSHIMEGNLIYKVQPEYPSLARQARIQGAVVLQAIISREGTIENLQVISGHPMLAPPAIQAVRQWRYRPYFLNGEAVEVETQVTVNFVLGGG